jgi:hypothetical protein
MPRHLLPGTGTQFAGTRGWVCWIFVSMPVESVAQVVIMTPDMNSTPLITGYQLTDVILFQD